MTTENTQNTAQELIVAVDFSETEKALQAAEQRFANVVHDVTTKDGMKTAKADVAELRTMRTTTEKKRVEAGRVLLAFKATNDAQAKGIIARISALEDPIKHQIDAEETRIETERLAKIEAERARVEQIMFAINAFRELPGKVAAWPSARIQAELEKIQAVTITAKEFDEFTEQASDAHAACLLRLQGLLADAVAREEAAERARQQEIELAAARERMAKLEREADERRLADERREREEREAAERKEAERVRVIRTQIRVIEACATSDHRYGVERLSEMLEELERHNPARGLFDFEEFADEAVSAYNAGCESLQSAIAEATRIAKEKAEREEADRADRQRLADEAAESARKAAAAELARTKAAAEAKAARLASTGLREGVQAALEWFTDNGIVDMAELMQAALTNAEPTKAKRGAKA